MPSLTDPLAALELVHALLSNRTDTLTQGEETASSTAKTSVSAHTDTALTPTDAQPPSVSAVSAPSVHALTVEKPVQNSENPVGVSASVHFGDTRLQDPWPPLLEQVDTLTAQLAELRAPRLRVDLEGRAVGYRSLEGLDPEQYAALVREMLSALARQYPEPRAVQVIALWPGSPSQPVRREVLAELGGEEDCDWF